MIRAAFSTLVCPEWKLDHVAAQAAAYGFDGVELRTFGFGSTRSACDPAMTDPEKVRRAFDSAGIDIACLATSIRLDQPIRPRVIGRTAFFDQERSVREARRLIDLASALGAPLVRIFGFEVGPGETLASTTKLILWRLGMVLDQAHNRGVRIALENGGSFSSAAELRDLIRRQAHPLLSAAYGLAPGAAAGDAPGDAVRTLSSDLALARVKDLDESGNPVPLGRGVQPVGEFVGALGAAGFDGWVVYEWDRAWNDALAGPDAVLPGVAERLYQWAAPAARAIA
ncbi:MAG: sugar phosphate isomerase/epimerase family protein [Phycisphaerales bacterium JB039]